jgi:hypothetical protein
MVRRRTGDISDRGRNVSDKGMDQFTKVLQSVSVALIGAGVLGVWNLSHNVTRLEERLTSYTKNSDKLLAQIVGDLRAQDARLDVLERVVPMPERAPVHQYTPPRLALPPKQKLQEDR